MLSEGDSYVTVLQELMEVDEMFDPQSESLLRSFGELRDKALAARGQERTTHQEEAVTLGRQIAKRGPELATVIEGELDQLDFAITASAS
jgi:hypothetical protein